MRLKTNSKLAEFYSDVYSARRPNDLCTYWWKLVAAFILLPLICVPLRMAKNDGARLDREAGLLIVLGFVFYVCAGLCYAWGLTLVELPFIPFWVSFLPGIVGFVSIAITVAVFLLFVFVGVQVVEYLREFFKSLKKESRKKENKDGSILWARIKAFKEKNCPIIEWVDPKIQK